MVLRNNQKGIALVLALMVMLVMSMMVAGLMMTIVNEKKLSSHQSRYVESLSIAEAGFSEAVTRMRLPNTNGYFIGDTRSPLNPHWKTVIFNGAPATPTDTSSVWVQSIQSGMAATDQLAYSTESWSGGSDTVNALTIQHKTKGDSIYFRNKNDGTISLVKYNSTYPANCYPVEVVTSTGRVGNSIRTIQVEVSKIDYPVIVDAAIKSDKPVTIKGHFRVCGHNHSKYTPNDTPVGNSTIGECKGYELCDRTHDVCVAVGCLPGITTTGDAVVDKGSGSPSEFLGEPASNTDPTNVFYNIEQILGFEATDEAGLLAAFPWKTQTSGLVNGYVISNGDYTLAGNSNSTGILWVKGNLTLTGNQNFRGLIYVEKDCKITGTLWCLGAVIVEGQTIATLDQLTGTGDILYCSDIIQQVVSAAGASFVRLNWRER